MINFLRILSGVLLLIASYSLFIGNNILTSFCLILSSICLVINERIKRKNQHQNANK